MSHFINENEEDSGNGQKVEEVPEVKEQKEEKVEEESKTDDSESTNVKSKDKKKFFTKKKIIIILIVFTVLCIASTVGAIYYSNSKNKGNIVEENEPIIKEEKETIIPDELGVKSYKEKFDYNDLEIIEEKYTRGDKLETEWGSEYYPLTINYVRIDGLKDKEIQGKINQEIKDAAFSLIDEEELKDSNISSTTISAYCTANFANVLSMNISKYNSLKEYPKDYKHSDAFIGLNFNLSTGEALKFSDLFTNTASIKDIISQGAYSSLAWKAIGGGVGGPGEDISEKDYSDLQDKIFEIIYAIKSNKKFEYCFSTNEINLYIKGSNITISMIDEYKNIAIYNRYKNIEGLYDGKYSKMKNLYVFMEDRSICEYSRTEEITDGFFIDIVVFCSSEGKYDNITNLLKKEIEREIEKEKQYLKNNPTKAKVITFCINLYSNNETSEVIQVSYAKTTHIMDKTYYDKNMFTEIIKQTQKSWHGGGLDLFYVFGNEEEVEREEFYQNRKYDLEGRTYWIEDSKYDYINRNNIIEKKTTYNALTGEIISTEYPQEQEEVIPETVTPETTQEVVAPNNTNEAENNNVVTNNVVTNSVIENNVVENNV